MPASDYEAVCKERDELLGHESDLIFHEAMHELGAVNGETFLTLAYRKAAEIANLQQRAESAEKSLLEAREKALEEAAGVIEKYVEDQELYSHAIGPYNICADLIRNLKAVAP